MRRKKTITASHAGTPSHIVVCPAKRASKVTAKEKARIAREKMHLAQKMRFVFRHVVLRLIQSSVQPKPQQ